jgi:hypothetical protein
VFNEFTSQRIFLLLLASLAVAGAVMGYVTHPAMYLLSIAIGVALVLVGMADATGMGLLLVRLPSMAELPVVARRLARRGG